MNQSTENSIESSARDAGIDEPFLPDIPDRTHSPFDTYTPDEPDAPFQDDSPFDADATDQTDATFEADPPLEEFFGPDGPVAASLRGYETRNEQIMVAEAIEAAISSGQICLTEAGTGVGKTLAYLVPAVRAAMRGKRIVISTHTISLQNQLIEKDLPLVLSLFPNADPPVGYELMKGRGNYLCKQNLDDARGDLLMITDPGFKRVLAWAGRVNCSGDVADLPFTFPQWSDLTSTPETCRGQECDYHGRCHYYDMRRAAADSSIVVVNHALFLSDLALRMNDPNSGVLPDYDIAILDEAHHIEDVATKTFGIEFGSKRIVGLMERLKSIRGLDIEKSRLQNLEDINNSLLAPFLEAGKRTFFLEDALTREQRSKAEECTLTLCNSMSVLQADLLKKAKDDELLRDRLQGFSELCGRARDEISRLMFETDTSYIRWGEVNEVGHGFKKVALVTLHLTPVSVREVLEQALWMRMREKHGAAVLLSATLANSGGFSYLRSRLGIPDEAAECIVGSPFDFKKQALLYVPRHLPPPPRIPNAHYVELLVAEIVRLLQLTGGRAFLLFTSRAMLNTVYARLPSLVRYPLFRQGDMPHVKLVEEFRASGNGCLLGLQSFWEGVDIQGEALSCVIIDRLPFAVPDSPITRARTQYISDEGGDWFRDYAVPLAQIRLKQGFGRLVRTQTDRGIVCVLDTRLIDRDYGAEFVRFLPPCSRASTWSRVERFWHADVNRSVGREMNGGLNGTLGTDVE